MRKKEQKTFGYAEVEGALAKVFAARGQHLLAMRGRLKAFQRAGLTPETPGRGKVIRYTIENIYDWAFGLALADFGLPPSSIIKFVKKGYFVKSYIPRIEKMDGDALFFCLLPYVLKEYDEFEFPFIMMEGSKISADKINGVGGSVALINLTKLKSDLDRALAVEPGAAS